MPGQLYVPFKISIADILFAMRDELPYGHDIDISCIAMEMLQNIFFERVNRFGRWEGVLGCYQQLIPVTLSQDELYNVDIQMHDFLAMLTDLLAATFPSMVMRPLDHYFLYPSNETDVVIYVPVSADLPPEYWSKAVPEEAIRNSIR